MTGSSTLIRIPENVKIRDGKDCRGNSTWGNDGTTDRA